VVVIQNPAALVISSLTVAPTSIGTGSAVTVVMTVQNTGTSSANLVSPSSLTTDAIGATFSAQVPAGSVTLVGGASQAFTWLLTPAQAGNVTVAASVAGTDAVSGLALAAGPATSAVVNVFAQANLAMVSVSFPAGTLSVGQSFPVTVTVQNGGVGNAESVTTQVLVAGFGAPLTLLSSPVPVTGTTIPGGSSTQIFVYTFSAAGAGTVAISASAAGFDVLGHPIVSNNPAFAFNGSGLVIQTPGALAPANLVLSPTQVSVGQVVTAILSVTNSGQATLTGVTGTVVPVPSVAGVLTAAAGYGLSGANLIGLTGTASFTYTFTATAPGTVSLTTAA